MNLFAVHMQGFTPETWPVVSFRSRIVCERLLNDFQSGDRILYVGIIEANDPIESRKLIGLAEINGGPIVTTQDVVNPKCIDKGCFNSGGSFKWPFGIQISRAWLFPKKFLPDAKSRIGNQYSNAPRGDYYRVDDDKVDAIMNLRQTEVTEFYQPT